ncbi:MAG: alginate export family protein, partial [Gemmatimonadota bacterium]
HAFVQVQDVRLFGEEASTLTDFSADALDVHQAWVEIGAAADLAGLRVGRQEVWYGGHRLIGTVNWTQQARAFDGARLRLGEEGARARVDAFAFQLSEAASPARSRDAAFLGSYAVVDLEEGRALDLYLLWNREEAGEADTEMGTAGARYVGGSGAIAYRVEGAWQFGDRAGRDVGAWFFGVRAGTSVAGGDGSLTLWYDHLSGDDPSDPDDGVFSTLFATNHKFYGLADLFLDIPSHTAGRGLRDAAIKAAWTPAPRWSVGLDLHHLRVAEDTGLASGHLANEVDLTVGRELTAGARLTGGLSYVGEGDALEPVRGIGESVTFAYVMLDVVF